MLDLMTNPKYYEYQQFIHNYSYPEFTSEVSHKHHIIPKCVGGDDTEENLILLTVSGHREAHKLLAKLAIPGFRSTLRYAYREFNKVFNRIPIREKTPPFWKLGGNMSYNRSRFPSYGNLTEVLKNLSKGAHWLLWSLVEKRDDKTNIAEFTPKDAAETMRVTRAYKELKDLDIVIRKRRQYYLINPAAFQPYNDCYEAVFLEWSKLNNT